MRILLPAFKALLILLLVLLVGVYFGWQGRHQWLPSAAKWWQKGYEIQEVEGLEFADRGRGFTVQRLLLRLDNGLLIEARDLHLTQWPVWTKLSGKPSSIDIREVRIFPAEDTTDVVPTTNARKGNDNTAAINNRRPHTPAQAQGDPATPPATLGQLLQQLHDLPLTAGNIRNLYWDERFSGALNFALSKQGSRITGVVSHPACNECLVNITLNNLLDRLTLESTIGDPGAPSLQAVLKLTKLPPDNSGAEVRWNSALSLNTEAKRIAILMDSWEKLAGVQPSTQLSTDIASGNLSLNATAETTDIIDYPAGIMNASLSLKAKNLEIQLPESVTGLPHPLFVSANSKLPMRLEASRLQPLQVASATGLFALAADPEQGPVQESNSGPEPLFRGELQLSTDTLSKASFQGDTNVARINALIPAQARAALLNDYSLTDLDGFLRIEGSADLPSPQHILQHSELAARNIQVQIHQQGEISARLKPRSSDHALQSMGLTAPKVLLQFHESAQVHALSWPGKLEFKAPALSLSAQNQSTGNQGTSSPTPGGSPLPFSARISDLACDDSLAASCTFKVAGNLKELTLASGLNASGATFAVDAAVNREPAGANTTQIISAPGQLTLNDVSLAADKFTINDISVRQPELFTQSAVCNHKSNKLHCSTAQAAIGVAPLTLAENSVAGVIHLADLTMLHDSARERISLESDFRSDSLVVTVHKQIQLDLKSSGKFKLHEERLTGSGEIQAGNLTLTNSWQHNLESGNGQVTAKIQQARFSPEQPLSETIKGLPIDIVDGSLAADIQLYWPDTGKQAKDKRITVKLEGVSATHNDIVAVGIDGDFSLRPSGDRWVTEKVSPVFIQRLDAGIPIDNLRFGLSLEKNQDFRLTGFSGEMLEGALTSDLLTWNLNGEERHSEIVFTGLSLQSLAKEMESENFVASGLLDARLPLTTDRQGVTVENGTLDARAPGGRLRYYGAFSPSMLTSNPQLKLIAGALEDYNYRAIHGTITYPLSGDLILNLKLTGRSDAVDANRDLVINLNLENNVPSMLKSLQASRDLTDVLEKAVQ